MYLDHPFWVTTGTSRRPTPTEFEYRKVPSEVEELPRKLTDIEEVTNIQKLIEKTAKFFITNIIQHTISQLVALHDVELVNLRATREGALYVSVIGGGYDRNEVKSGNAPDSYGDAIAFSQKCTRIDILTWDNPCIFKRSRDGVTWDDEFEIPADFFYSIDVDCLQFNIKNKTAGQTCRYQVTGWYKS